MSMQNLHHKHKRRWIIKVGSALITDSNLGVNLEAIDSWAQQIAYLRQSGIEVLLVSSGAVAEGMTRIRMPERPTALNQLQALASIGQAGLVQTYEASFKQYGIRTAQVLLTHEDLSNRRRYLNARSTLLQLIDYHALPIINENDTVSFDEFRFGDNDTLAALVSNLVEADHLIILTDQEGLYNKDPRQHQDATFIHEDSATNSELLNFAGGAGSQVGTGGMRTKVIAARRAARSGCTTIIASGKAPEVLIKLAQGKKVGTKLTPHYKPLAARKQWLANQLKEKGTLQLDHGAIQALLHGKSLLPIGVKDAQGSFTRGDVVNCVDESNQLVARGLVNYDIKETKKILGHSSKEIITLLGYIDDTALIHRDNLVLMNDT